MEATLLLARTGLERRSSRLTYGCAQVEQQQRVEEGVRSADQLERQAGVGGQACTEHKNILTSHCWNRASESSDPIRSARAHLC